MAVSPNKQTATLTNVAASATSVQLLAAAPTTVRRIIVNDGANTLYVKYGATASITSYTYKIGANTTLELPLPLYGGRVDGIWDVAAGTARITEY